MVNSGSTTARGAIFHLTAFRLAAFAMAAFLLSAVLPAETNLSFFFLHRQDRWLLLAGAVLLALCSWHLRDCRTPFAATWRLAFFAGSFMGIAAFIGHFEILSSYDMSRDEQMATFDAAVFSSGQLVAPLPPFWQGQSDALNTMFMYPAEQHKAWISAYLPLNAALRSMVDFVADPALTGPLMTLIGALALWGCSRRIWPENREAAVVGLLLYVGSGQILFNGMTAYAMPAHLTLNLVWLWLFLRRAWWTDLSALAVGFLAVGLHQPIMHPMFAGPVLCLLLLERNWRRAAFFVFGYAAIGAFWLWWPNAMWTLINAGAEASRPEGVDYFTRLVLALATGDGLRLANMMANLLRFVAWQHLLLVPLAMLGVKVVRRDRLAGALAAGVLLTISVMTVILPYQGHGFGYRYVHGLIGNVILLAIYGWTTLGDDSGKWRVLLLRTTAASLVLMLTMQSWMAHRFYEPYAKLSARIDQSDADYVIIGESDAPFSADLVINPPMLDKRPVRLLRGALDPSLIRALCSEQITIALVGEKMLEPISDYYGFTSPTFADRDNQEIALSLRHAGCRVMLVE